MTFSSSSPRALTGRKEGGDWKDRGERHEERNRKNGILDNDGERKTEPNS